MTTINPDAVIDAIARCFPDGFDYGAKLDADDRWLQRLCAEFGPSFTTPIECRTGCADVDAFDADAHRAYIVNVISGLLDTGRLSRRPNGDVALSWSEQARRVLDVVDSCHEWHPAQRESMTDMIAKVLSGKLNPKDV